MKKLTLLTILSAALALPVFADKIEGEAVCPKCELKEAEKCGLVIKTATGNVYAEQNATAKDFHKEICKGGEKVTAEGKITEKDGKKWITLESIAAAK